MNLNYSWSFGILTPHILLVFVSSLTYWSFGILEWDIGILTHTVYEFLRVCVFGKGILKMNDFLFFKFFMRVLGRVF